MNQCKYPPCEVSEHESFTFLIYLSNYELFIIQTSKLHYIPGKKGENKAATKYNINLVH